MRLPTAIVIGVVLIDLLCGAWVTATTLLGGYFLGRADEMKMKK